jgi:tetratricopeptide (TPR) repeat protein
VGGTDSFDTAQADRDYEAAFRGAGLGTPDDPPEQVAERVRATGVRRAVVAALDRWAGYAPDDRRKRWAILVARSADPDPDSGWRDRARNPAVWRDPAQLAELARAAPLDAQSVPLHVALAHRLLTVGGDGVGFLRRVQAAHPDDFEATYLLAFHLDRLHDPQAIGYYRAALVIRPGSLGPLVNLGNALEEHGLLAEAAEHRQAVVRLHPDNPHAHYNLALSYQAEGRLGAAADECRQAIRLTPTYAAAHSALAKILFDQGEFEEARQRSRQSLELTPACETLADSPRELRQRCENVRFGAREVIKWCDRLLSLGGRLGAIAQGSDAPSGQEEAFAFAELCSRRQRPAAAARLYAAALSGPASWREITTNYIRHRAACVAVRAGLGEGEDAPPEGPDRAVLRARALTLLVAARDSLAADCARGPAESRREAVRALRRWAGDVALAGVRDPAALARIDADERRRWQAFWASLVPPAAGDPLPTLGAARAYAGRGEWKAAAESYVRLFELSPNDFAQEWFELAAVELLTGDRDAYRKTCARLAHRSLGTKAVRPYHVARTCTLAPHAVDDLTPVTRLSADELKQYGTQYWSLTEQSALLHRAGRSQEAVALLERSLKANDRPGVQLLNWLWLALACHSLGRTDEARGWLDRAGRWLDSQGGVMPDRAEEELGLHLHNWLEAHVLRHEAEALIRPDAKR